MSGIPVWETTCEQLQSFLFLQEEKSIVNGVEGVKVIVGNFSTIITLERKVLSLAAEADDEGTVSLMSDYISQTEKTLWMLSSYLK